MQGTNMVHMAVCDEHGRLKSRHFWNAALIGYKSRETRRIGNTPPFTMSNATFSPSAGNTMQVSTPETDLFTVSAHTMERTKALNNPSVLDVNGETRQPEFLQLARTYDHQDLWGVMMLSLTARPMAAFRHCSTRFRHFTMPRALSIASSASLASIIDRYTESVATFKQSAGVTGAPSGREREVFVNSEVR